MSYDPSRSQISKTKLEAFVSAAWETDLTSIPPIGPLGVERLMEHDIHSPIQLLGKFLTFRHPDMDTRAHCEAFYSWLRSIGVNCGRGGVVRCIAMKANVTIPGIYNEDEYA